LVDQAGRDRRYRGLAFVAGKPPKGYSVLEALQRRGPRKLQPRERFEDETRFLRSWLERPLVTGALTPSGKMLARAMASYVDPRLPGPVIELGPGTGPVTDALIRRGIAQDRLVLFEYNLECCRLLARRFPKATIVQGDAYDIGRTLEGAVDDPACATLSSLPLLTKPPPQRLELLRASQALMHPSAPFVQFTYGVAPPIPARARDYTVTGSNRVWLNLPPARVWVYRRHAGAEA
jgi:phosphatidylethanolamine/phosphatidyl-N-methylethanolamine N-methyltransferase